MVPQARAASFAEKRRLLQLETLYDLAVALHAERSEEQVLAEVLEMSCAVLDPAAAVAVTRDPFGRARAFASVGWDERTPDSAIFLDSDLWREILTSGRSLARQSGRLGGRDFRELLAVPLAYRGVFLGYLAMVDKEARGEDSPTFSDDDRRFLESVTALAAVSLDSARKLEALESERERLSEENKILKSQLAHEVAGQRIVAHGGQMRRVLDVIERVAPRGVSVLLRGESGTGKELAAKLLHLLSKRSGALIALNCAALPDSLLESELFGIEGGVATGVTARPGKLELADGGTLFLDEIGDMPVTTQVKLLRALQEREVVRVGGKRPIPVDVRLVAATHRNLESMVREGAFREDLYYRLKGVEVELPPLRERREDVPHLVRTFVEDFCRREHLPVPVISPEALALWMGHVFPGNVRELKNVVEGALSLAEGEVTGELAQSLLGPAPAPAAAAPGGEILDLATLEQLSIRRALELTGGNKSAAAKLLGLDRRTLLRKGF